MRVFLSWSNLRVGAVVAFAGATLFTACSGNQGNSVAPIVSGATPTPKPTSSVVASATPTSTASATATPKATPTPVTSATPSTACAGGTNLTTASIGAAGGSITTSAASGTFGETFAGGAFSATTTVSLSYFAATSLPAPLVRFSHVDRYGHRLPMFTAGAGNTYVTAFCTSFGGAALSGSAAVTGSGIVPSSIASGSVLNIAINQSGTWVDVGTALVGASGSFQSTIPTSILPGVTQAGNYLVYLPAAGSTTQVNLGFALLADDGTSQSSSGNGLQFVQIEGTNGVALPTPTSTYFPIAGGDLDGEALTPNAESGATVDGGNTVYFFSGIPQHKFVLSPTTLDITNYGGDGDSIAALPDGDEDIASGDDGADLVVISGILAGKPTIADTISDGGLDRDGLVISQDGKVLLSRGGSGIDVISITPSAPHAGSTGSGTVSYTFKVVNTLTTVPTPFFEDGRDEMAISPTDSTRAVVAGANIDDAPIVTMITGLPNNAVAASVRVRTSGVARVKHVIRRDVEPSFHRKPYSAIISGPTELTAVEISPDGRYAYVNSNEGIYVFSGVDTGTLTQVGTAYAPSLPVSGSAACTWPTSDYGAASIGITPDGKYLVGVLDCGLAANGTTQEGPGVLFTAPIGTNGALGNPVGQLNYVVAPYNDQIEVH